MQLSPTQTSPFAGSIEAGDQVEERGLAGTAWSHHAKELARSDFQIEAVQHVDAFAAATKILVNARNANNRPTFSHCDFLSMAELPSRATLAGHRRPQQMRLRLLAR